MKGFHIAVKKNESWKKSAVNGFYPLLVAPRMILEALLMVFIAMIIPVLRLCFSIIVLVLKTIVSVFVILAMAVIMPFVGLTGMVVLTQTEDMENQPTGD